MGKWIIVDDTEYFIARCSECGKKVDSRILHYNPDKFLFCPSCKAKMENTAGRNAISKEKNKMEQVAQLFNRKLGEEFKIKDLSNGTILIASFDNYGIRAYVDGFSPDSWKPRWDMVMRLIIGESAVIIDD